MFAYVLLAIIGTFLYGTFTGWWVHWILHQRWSGRFYNAHMTHHVRLYPPTDLLSERYRDPGKDNTVLVFTPALTILFGGLELLMWCLGVPWWILCIMTVEGVVVGTLHDLMHTWFHLKGVSLTKKTRFLKLRYLHFFHHSHMQTNLGIFWFGWDRLFGTYRGRE